MLNHTRTSLPIAKVLLTSILLTLVGCGGGGAAKDVKSGGEAIASSLLAASSVSVNLSSHTSSSDSSSSHSAIAKNSSSSASVLLGGTIQGKPLNLMADVSTLIGTPPGASGPGLQRSFNRPTASVSDGTNLYVTDANNHIVRKIVIASGVVSTLAGSIDQPGYRDGIGTAAGFDFLNGITTDGINLYVTESSNTIRKIVIATGQVTTLAGLASQRGGNTDGIGTGARFSGPVGITTDGKNLYVADSNNRTIRQVVIATGEVTTLAGSAVNGVGDGPGSEAGFWRPEAIATDGKNLYVADSSNGKVRQIVIASRLVSTLEGKEGVALALQSPDAIIVQDKNLYIVDSATCNIVKIIIATQETSTFAGSGCSWETAEELRAVDKFHAPSGISSDGKNLYITETYDNTIKKIALATAEVSRLAGTLAMREGGVDGMGSAASIYSPGNITSDGTHLYVLEENTIRKIEIATAAVTTLAQLSSESDSSHSLSGITTDGLNLYVTDIYTVRGWSYQRIPTFSIRKIVIATGEVRTIATVERSFPARSFSYEFAEPVAITSDGINLYMCDGQAHIIQKLDLATYEVSRFAGNGSDFGDAEGNALAVSFDWPESITSDGKNLYIADGDSIRRIVIATGLVSTLAEVNSPEHITTDGTHIFVTSSDDAIYKIVIATGSTSLLAGTASVAGSADGVGAAARFNALSGITSDGLSLYVSDSETIRKIQ